MAGLQVYKNCVPITSSRNLDVDEDGGRIGAEYAASNSTSASSKPAASSPASKSAHHKCLGSKKTATLTIITDEDKP